MTHTLIDITPLKLLIEAAESYVSEVGRDRVGHAGIDRKIDDELAPFEEAISSTAALIKNPTNSEDVTHAAMCIWENLLELLRKKHVVLLAFENTGYAEMRHFAMSLAADCNADWETASKYGYDACFDWEFVPAWINENVEFDKQGCRRIERTD